MNNAERMKLIAGELNDFLRRYKRPEHLDNDQSMIEIKAMATSINKRIPAGLDKVAMLHRTDDCFQEVAELFRGSAWPKPALFVDAMANLNRSTFKSLPTPEAEWKLDPIKIAAIRMNAGEAVGDNWLYGRDAVVLMQTGEVTKDTLHKYRSALYFNAKKLHKKDEADRREALWIEKHEAAEKLFHGQAKTVNPAAVSAISQATGDHLRRADGSAA